MPVLAGWLFADLFLVLFVVGLASLPPSAHPKPRPRHTSPPPSRVLDKPVSFTLKVSPSSVEYPATRAVADTRLVHALEMALRSRHLANRQAGVLLVFASGPEYGIDQAVTTAQSVVSVVRHRVKAFSMVSGKGYWSGSGDNFEFEVFFFSVQTKNN